MCFFINITIFNLENEVKVISIDTTVENACVENGIEISEKKNLNSSNTAECLDLNDFINTLKKHNIQEVHVHTSCVNYDDTILVYWSKTYNAWVENGAYTYEITESIPFENRFIYSELESISYSEIVLSRDVARKTAFLFFLAIIEVAVIGMFYSYLSDKKQRK